MFEFAFAEVSRGTEVLDDPDNFKNLDSTLSGAQIRHSLIPDYQLVETVGRYSTRNRRLRGLGMRMAWDIEATCFHGASLDPNDVSANEQQLQMHETAYGNNLKKIQHANEKLIELREEADPAAQDRIEKLFKSW